MVVCNTLQSLAVYRTRSDSAVFDVAFDLRIADVRETPIRCRRKFGVYGFYLCFFRKFTDILIADGINVFGVRFKLDFGFANVIIYRFVAVGSIFVTARFRKIGSDFGIIFAERVPFSDFDDRSCGKSFYRPRKTVNAIFRVVKRKRER